jgi:hypothetical protein
MTEHQVEDPQSYIEEALTELAHEKHPRAQRWGGERGSATSRRWVCYICDEEIASWSGKYRRTKSAERAIQEHHDVHVRELAS